MSVIEDMPFYIVIIGVLLNLIIGLTTHISFMDLMLRSIIVTILCSIIGYLLSNTINSALKASEEKKKRADRESSEEDSANNQANPTGNNTSTLDIRVPPIDEKELLNYGGIGDDGDDEFVEMNPMYLHKNNQYHENE